MHGQNSQENWSKIETPSYSIEFPQNWKVNDSLEWVDFVLQSPLKDKDNIRLTHIVMTDKDHMIENDFNLDKKIQEFKSQLLLTPGRTIVSEKRIENYHQFIIDDTDREYDLTTIVRIWVIGIDEFTLSLTTDDSCDDNYNELCLDILNSFRIKN